ncbi:hypothetical protein [Sciscionella sediminilitoris]|uniref:hypothetical protein n=1 Tax=Sciscionella sediminilitoris TaxID=1445613 RepID=UPI0004DF58F2|nr:hypothetical protein [Sciscionella sp. SE31]
MPWFAAHIELDVRPTHETNTDTFFERLQPHHASTGLSPYGYLDAQLSIEARTLPEASTAATRAVTEAARAAGYGTPQIVALEVLTEAEHTARQDNPVVPPLLSKAEAAAELGVVHQRVQQRADELGGIKVGNAWVFPAARIAADRDHHG